MRAETKQKIENLLSSANLRRTGPRAAILNVLLEAGKPLTQDQIAASLGRAIPNKVTIYRTLESFCRAGLVHKAFMHKRAWHFELADKCTESQCHPHFTCKRCGVISCLVGLSVSIVEGMKKGFVIHRQQIRLEGLCPRCGGKKGR
ncbi:MAG TPA: transcriptional repressor [Sedimentisphaerales bacterium]|nr:transcriptional repressor [Sedimentisphaerales bacterium]